MSEQCIKPAGGETAVALEQFIPDHVFLYATKGSVKCFDGSKSMVFKAGECCLVRKNRLAKYQGEKGNEEFEKIFFCFDRLFLQSFEQKYKPPVLSFKDPDTFIKIEQGTCIPDFIRSLIPYSDNTGKIEEAFEDLKYEELLILLLKIRPELAGILFDYGIPQKIDLEEFMNRNYKFNVRMERFAYLTGRSLSAFKRDFKMIFNQAPNTWLVQKRLEEAHFLIAEKRKRASEIYLDLGFEDLSHFSFAFKKLFGLRPTELAERTKHVAGQY